MNNCNECQKIYEIPKTREKYQTYFDNYCSFDCHSRHTAKLNGQIWFEDLVNPHRFTKYASYVINVDWEYMESSLQRYEADYGLDLDPDYQRGHVWTESQQSAYVEYILRGGYAAKELYFNSPDWMGRKSGRIELVDGKQRLTAVRKFLNNEVQVFGKYRKDIYGRLPTECGFKFYINNLIHRKQVLQWYLDLNSGGTPHTTDELEKVRKMLNDE